MILLQVFPEKKKIPNKHIVPNNCRGFKILEKNKPGKWDGNSGRNEEYMNENSILLFYYIYLLYKSFEGVCYI